MNIYFVLLFGKLIMTFLLPGQPVPVRAGTLPAVGPGVYLRHGQLRASLAGTLPDDPAQPPAIHRRRPHPPAPNSLILGTVTRLSPLQAVVAISVVDGIPLPPGEEFTGVIRTQDIRATEKDKVKIADCFRGGDVVKGLVVSRTPHTACPLTIPDVDLPRRRAQLLHHNRTQRPRRHLCHQRGRWVHSPALPPAAHTSTQAQRWNRCRGRRCGVRERGG